MPSGSSPVDDHTVKIWDVFSSKPQHNGRIDSIDFANDGLTMGATAQGVAKIWDALGRAVLSPLDVNDTDIVKIAHGPHGKFLAVGNGRGLVYLINAQSRQLIWTLDSEADEIKCLEFSANGQLLVACGGTRVICWDVASGERNCSIELPNAAIDVATMEQQSKCIVVDEVGDISCFDLHSGQFVNKTEPLRSPATCITLSPNQEVLVTGHEEGGLRFWDGELQASSSPLSSSTQQAVTSVEYTVDGSRVVAASGRTVQIWDPRVETAVLTLNAGADVSSIAVNPQGTSIACGDVNGRIMVWEAEVVDVEERDDNARVPVLNLQ